jgi:FkbM family methyltransferase
MSQIKTFGSHLVDFDLIPKEGGVFIDAGTCQGNFIDDIFKHVENPHIFALEPNRTNIDYLVEKFIGTSGMFIIKNALVGSDQPNQMRFADFTKVGLPEWGNVTGLYENRRPEYYDVNTMTIRDLLDIMPSGPIHHLKMDIEGCEHGVIADLTEGDAKRIQQISLEVHNGIQDMQTHLEKIGYDVKFEKGELYAIARLKK